MFILTTDFLVPVTFCARGALLTSVPALEGATTAFQPRPPGGRTSGAGSAGVRSAVKGSLLGPSGGEGSVLPPEGKVGLSRFLLD